MTKTSLLLALAQREAPQSLTWADFSNFLFDQQDGILAKAFPTQAERTAFLKTEEFQQMHTLLEEVRARTGIVEGATPKRSVRLELRMPTALQESLTQEANRKGIAFDQLVLTKLAQPLP
jgi:predicted HicB family RNase H-like nuclease